MLEKLCRYALRAPFALERLRVGSEGRVEYTCKGRAGAAARVRVMTVTELLARVAALVPPPRYPDVRYHGVLAPNAAWRAQVVSAAGPAPACAGGHAAHKPEPFATAGHAPAARDAWIPWAELLRRIYGIDALRCPFCAQRMQILAVLLDRAAVQRLREHVGPDGTGPPRARSVAVAH